jgi:hypothetical protein
VLAGLGCQGTRRLIFDPIEPRAAQVGPIPMVDAGKVVLDSGHKSPVVMDMKPMPDDGTEDAGTDEPDKPDVDFVWTESLPGQGTCRAGRYSGSFDCVLDDDTFPIPLSFSGEIAFTLEGSPEAQRLMITDGALSGLWLYSGMSGSLDCLKKTWDADSVDGSVLILDADPENPFLIGFPSFNAGLHGRFDDQDLVIDGTIAAVNERGDKCSGTLRVSAVP